MESYKQEFIDARKEAASYQGSNGNDILLSFLLLDCFDALKTPRFNAL